MQWFKIKWKQFFWFILQKNKTQKQSEYKPITKKTDINGISNSQKSKVDSQQQM